MRQLVPSVRNFETKGLSEILHVFTAKKTNEWVLNKVGVKRELLDTTMKKQTFAFSAERKVLGFPVCQL